MSEKMMPHQSQLRLSKKNTTHLFDDFMLIDMKTDSIPKPEEDILPFCGAGSSTCYNDALRNMSPSALYVPEIY